MLLIQISFYKPSLENIKPFKSTCTEPAVQPSRFSVNFAKFLRTPFFKEHLWWLLLTCNSLIYGQHNDQRLANHFKYSLYISVFSMQYFCKTKGNMHCFKNNIFHFLRNLIQKMFFLNSK